MCNHLKVKLGDKQSVKLSSLQREEEEGGKIAGNNPKEVTQCGEDHSNLFYDFFHSPLARYTSKSHFGLFLPATMTLDFPKPLCR